jgi:hypothetical protein
MIHLMLGKEIPVIHLLYVKGLVQKYHLPWDPPVQPDITDESVRFGSNNRPLVLVLSLVTILWFLGFLTLFHMLYNRKERESMDRFSPTLPTK